MRLFSSAIVAAEMGLGHMPPVCAGQNMPPPPNGLIDGLLTWVQGLAGLAAQAPGPLVYGALLLALGLMDARARARR